MGAHPVLGRRPGHRQPADQRQGRDRRRKAGLPYRIQEASLPVVADGFYEWKRENGKTPYYFRLKDESPFAFAGLYERWEKGDEPVESCTLITCEANGIVGAVHNRMPVILKPDDYARWIDTERPQSEALMRLLAPLPDDWLSAQPVGKLVNNPRNEDPRCIERVA